MQVTKRSGRTELFDVTKIRKVINWCCEGFDVNPLELESSFTDKLYNKMPTSDIQDHLIESAKLLCNFNSPDWRYVAGRLMIWGYTQQSKINRGYGYGHYLQWVKQNLKNHSYDCRLAHYKDDELIEAGTWIKPELDRDYDLAGATLLTSRYLLPNELIQEAYLTCSLLLALPESPSKRLKFAKEVYESISQRKISLATPILANLRVPDGSLTSCFIVSMEDNLESIFREITNTARISKHGGGVGVNISSIRATGSTLKQKENGSGGVLPWMSILNQTALAVNQNGKRAGAVTIGLDTWHYDLPEFLECQAETGDPRRKAFDIFPQVIASDVFMEAVKNNQEWYLVDPYEVRMKLGYHLPQLWGHSFRVAYGQVVESIKVGGIKLFKQVMARDIFKQIMRSQLETGMPYIAFKDAINKANPNKYDGYIPQVNLCVTGDTTLLTKNGHIRIDGLVGQEVEIWNGRQWSTVIPKKTGKSRVIKITITDFATRKQTILKTTPDHDFYVIDVKTKLGMPEQITNQNLIKVKAKDLTIRSYVLMFPSSIKLVSSLDVYKGVRANITSIQDEGEFSDTYCVTEPLENKAVFNGILTGNCVESYSNVQSGKYAHCCNLVSINLANVNDYEYEHICNTSVRLLDNTIELTNPPFEDAEKHNNRYRTIGVGFMGLADWLAKNMKTYKDVDSINRLFDSLSYYCVRASALLAKERGAFDAYQISEWAKGNLVNAKPLSWFEENSFQFDRWEKLAKFIQEYGIRNSHIMAIAPNTSSSLIHGCTASVLPPYKKFHYDKCGKGTVPVAPPFVQDYPFGYVENTVLDQNIVVDAIATIQKWIDTGISMELVFNLNEGIYHDEAITAEEIYNVQIKAWESGCKAIYYVRSVQKDDFKDNSCVSCAN